MPTKPATDEAAANAKAQSPTESRRAAQHPEPQFGKIGIAAVAAALAASRPIRVDKCPGASLPDADRRRRSVWE